MGQLVRVAKAVAATADVVMPSHRGVTVLLYHRVGGGTSAAVDLDPKLFADQLDLLVEHAVPVSLGTALAALDAAPHPGPDPVVVTFDDGTADVVETALPLLVERGIPALLYVATDSVETGVALPGGGRPVSWAALRDAVSSGWLELGSHTHSHLLLDRAPRELVDGELDTSIDLLTSRCGVAVEHFAYPKGVLGSASSRAAVEARFASAAVAGTQANRYGRTDPYRLQRTPVQRADGLRWFARKLSGGMRLEGDLRRVRNRWRYAGATR